MGSGSQQFCLKWNNHHSNMLNVFEHLLSSEALVDVTLACEGLSLKAHKMVLSACSPFFQSLFLENPCKHPIVILKDMRYADLKAIIDFMYRGEVNVSQNQLSALLKTAETLKVKGLAEVSGEDGQSNGSGVVQQEVVQQTVPQSTAAPTGGSATQGTTTPASGARAETPPLSRRKRGRPRRRSLSDSNRSDSEDQVPAKIREAESPEVIEDRDMDTSSSTAGAVEGSNGVQKLPLPLQTQTQPQSQVSRLAIDDATSGDEGDFLPSKLMEQSMTTENVPVFPESQTAGSTVSPTPSQRLMLGSSSLVERSMQGPSTSDSQALVPVSQSSEISGTGHSSQDIPEDIKPTGLVSYDEPSLSPVAGPSHHSQDGSAMMMYMDSSGVPAIPGPSNYQPDKQSSSQPQPSQVISVGRNKKGDPLIFCDGFLYRSYYNKWRCSCTIDQKCPGMLHTVNFKDPYLLVKHTHPPLTNFLELLEEVPGLSGKVKQQISSELSILPVEGTTWLEPLDEEQSAPPPVMGYWTPMTQHQPKTNLPALMQNPNILTQKRVPKPSVKLSFKTNYIPNQSLRKRGRPRKNPNEVCSYKPYATKYYNSKTNSLSSVYMYKKASKFFTQTDSIATTSFAGEGSTQAVALNRPLNYKSAIKRGNVGRPRKTTLGDLPLIKKKRGRPRKVPIPVEGHIVDSPMIKIEKLDNYIPAAEWLSVIKKEPDHGATEESDNDSPAIIPLESSTNESAAKRYQVTQSEVKETVNPLANPSATIRTTKLLSEFEGPRVEVAMKPPKRQRLIKPGRVVVTPAKSARMKTIPSEEYRARDHEVLPPTKIVMPPICEESTSK